MLFALRNVFERRGYTFVEADQQPDFFVVVDGSASYEESYIPPRKTTLPTWVPGKTITTEESSQGSAHVNTFGDVNVSGLGTYRGTSKSTVSVPGHVGTKTYVSEGYTIGRYYPALLVSVFDGESLENVWSGTAVAASKNGDIRVAGQELLATLASEFPLGPSARWCDGGGFLGVSIGVLTNDGNNYFPTITYVEPSSPAALAGIEEYDMLLRIDGEPMKNRPYSEAVRLLCGEPGSCIALDIRRDGRSLKRLVTRTSVEARSR